MQQQASHIQSSSVNSVITLSCWKIWDNSIHKLYPTSYGPMQLQASLIHSYTANLTIIVCRIEWLRTIEEKEISIILLIVLSQWETWNNSVDNIYPTFMGVNDCRQKIIHFFSKRWLTWQSQGATTSFLKALRISSVGICCCHNNWPAFIHIICNSCNNQAFTNVD